MVSKIKRSQKILAFALILALANLFSLPNQGNAETVNALAGTVDKAQLERELQALEKQIADFEAQLSTTRSEKNTLAAKVKELKTEQSKLSLQIRSTNLMIGDLEEQIDTTQNSISDLEKKIDSIKSQISGTIISIYEQDNKSIVSA
jgi:chromosome segregation ATPase